MHSSANAEQTGDSVNFNFSGTFILSTPCTVNNDQIIEVAFGNIGVKRVDGVNYSQTIPVSLDCHGAPESSPLELTISGTAESFDSAALTTSAEGLGIKIQQNGFPLQIGKALSITLDSVSSLKLTAVPVKDPVKVLTEQSFNASATLTANYQ